MGVENITFTFRLWVLLVTLDLAERTIEICYKPLGLKLGPYKLAGAHTEPRPEEPDEGDEDDGEDVEPMPERSRAKTRKPNAKRARRAS